MGWGQRSWFSLGVGVKRAAPDQGVWSSDEPAGPPEPKRPAPPKPSVSFQHPVSELVSKHQGAIFNFTG